jgi:hypothetical protein
VIATATRIAIEVLLGIMILLSMAFGGQKTYCPWVENAEAASSAEQEDPFLRDLSLRDNRFEEHHGLVWKRDGVLAEPNKIAPTEGRLIPEKAHNFKTPLHYVMSILPLIYWKIITEQTNEYAA